MKGKAEVSKNGTCIVSGIDHITNANECKSNGGFIYESQCYVKKNRCRYSREKEGECYLTSEELKKENCQARDNYNWDSEIGCVKRPQKCNEPMCATGINGECRTDETECCSDGQITLTFTGEAESRCFTPLKEIWDEAKNKTNKTLQRTCNGEEECNTKANELGYTLFKDGDECRLPKDKLVEKHFDDMKTTCIDEGATLESHIKAMRQ